MVKLASQFLMNVAWPSSTTVLLIANYTTQRYTLLATASQTTIQANRSCQQDGGQERYRNDGAADQCLDHTVTPNAHVWEPLVLLLPDVARTYHVS